MVVAPRGKGLDLIHPADRSHATSHRRCTMRRLLPLLLLAVLFAAPARAQYMFLDANGDGASTLADKMSPNGVATICDVWIKTNLNRDGSPGVCPTGDGALDINSYVVNLQA